MVAVLRAGEWERAYGSEERVLFIQALPCSVPGCGNRPCENAHAVNGGMSRKADADTILPLCAEHHLESHRGVKTFMRKYRIVLLECAAATDRLWLAYLAGDYHLPF